MTLRQRAAVAGPGESQSAFVRGFIDDQDADWIADFRRRVSIRVRARLHR